MRNKKNITQNPWNIRLCIYEIEHDEVAQSVVRHEI